MEQIKEFFEIISKYRQYVIREVVKIAVVILEGAGVYLITRYVYEVDQYAILSGAIVSLIAYLVSWMSSQSIKKSFAITYTLFALIGAALNVSKDYYKYVNDASGVEAYNAEKGRLEAKLPARLDLNCGQSADWVKIACSKQQIEADANYSQVNAALIAEIQDLPKPIQKSISTIQVTTILKWCLILLIAIAPGSLFYFASTEEVRVITKPLEIPERLPDSFNKFAELIEKHFGYKKTTFRDWLRGQGWIQPEDGKKLVNEATEKLQKQIEFLQECIAERQL